MGACDLIILSLALATASHGGGILYVDDNAAPAGDGAGWPTAYRFLQDALADAAASGGAIDEIRVAQGVYTPDRDEANPDGGSDCHTPHPGPGCTDPDCEAAVCAVLPMCCEFEWDAACALLADDLCGDPRVATFQLVNGVTLAGGYAGLGDPGNPDHRDIVGQETVLSGDLLGDDDTDGSNAENAYHVATGSGVSGSASIDGFTITAGNANGPAGPPDYHGGGGGMSNIGGSPTVNVCVFVDNAAVGGGAGMINFDESHPTITSCVFEGNSVPDGAGGGILNSIGCSPSIEECLFHGNVALEGGGIQNETSSHPMITDCEFTGNTADLGAGMLNFDGSAPTVTGCTFSLNPASTAGGGIFNYESSPAIAACTFDRNTAVVGGGGILNTASSEPTVTDCEFMGNEAELGGGMRNVVDCSPTVTGCTFSENAAVLGGGGIFNNANSNPQIIYSTFVGNTAGNYGAGIRNFDDASPTVIGCRFEGNTAGINGGGMASQDGCAPLVVNSLFAGNDANNRGGAVSTGGDTDSRIVNCTIINNDSTFGAGGVSTASGPEGPSVMAVINSVVWGNADPQLDDIDGAVTTVRYSDIQGGWTGPGTDIHDVDPAFADAEGRLAPGSPLIDAADNTEVPPDTCDLDDDSNLLEPLPFDRDGNPRFHDDPDTPDSGNPDGINPIVDIGAYEFQGASCPCDCEDPPDGAVDVGDFLALLAQWGTPGPCDCEDPPDGAVDVGDFLALLAAWGPCP